MFIIKSYCSVGGVFQDTVWWRGGEEEERHWVMKFGTWVVLMAKSNLLSIAVAFIIFKILHLILLLILFFNKKLGIFKVYNMLI